MKIRFCSTKDKLIRGITLVAFLASTGVCLAETIDWRSYSSPFWGNIDNWSPRIIPDSDDYVRLNKTADYPLVMPHFASGECDTFYSCTADGAYYGRLVVDKGTLEIDGLFVLGRHNAGSELIVKDGGLLETCITDGGCYLGHGQNDEDQVDTSTVTITVDDGTILSHGNLNIGQQTDAVLNLESGSIIVGSPTVSKDIYLAAYGTGYADVTVKGLMQCSGKLGIANGINYTDFDLDNPHAYLEIDGGTVIANDIEMCRISPNGKINIKGDGFLIITSDVRDKIEHYVREGWITAQDGQAELLVTYSNDTSTGEEAVVLSVDGHLKKAWNPDPADGATDHIKEPYSSGMTCYLDWNPTAGVAYHYVYIGDSEAVVEAITPGDETAPEHYTTVNHSVHGSYTSYPGAQYDHQYYWRVDEEDADGNIVKGNVWSFKLVDYQDEDFVVWTEPSTEHVFPNSRPESFPASPSHSISLARNEYESFQVAILPHPDVDLSSAVEFNVSYAANTQPVGGIVSYEFFQVGYVPVYDFVDEEADYLDEGAQAGWWPDLLLPIDTSGQFYMTVDGTDFDRYAQAIWVKAYASDTAGIGTHSGTLTIDMLDASSTVISSVDIDVSATVLGVTLPDGPGECRTAFGVGEYRDYPDLEPDESTWTWNWITDVNSNNIEYHACLKTMLDYRLNPNCLYRTSHRDNADLQEADYPGSTELYGLQDFFDGGLNAINIWDKSDQDVSCELTEKVRLCTSATEIEKMSYAHLWDEVPPTRKNSADEYSWIYMLEDFSVAKARVPNIPLMTTSSLYMFWGNDPRWVPSDDPNGLMTGTDPLADMYSYNLEWIVPVTSWYDKAIGDDLRSEDFEMWSYIHYPSMFLVWPLSSNRTAFWQMYNQSIDGYLYYALNGWLGNDRDKGYGIELNPTDEYDQPIPLNPFIEYEFHYNHLGESYSDRPYYGQGELIYPSKTKDPIVSIRLENVRDGIEDYNLLKMLENATGSFDFTNTICEDVAWDLNAEIGNNHTYDYSDIKTAREDIANEILTGGQNSNSVYNQTADSWHSTIADAIGASSNGDVLILQTGTYTEMVDLTEKALTIRSADPDDASQVVLDGENVRPVVLCAHGTANASTLEGLTIQNGSVGVDDTDMFLHWKLDETSGLTINDSSGNNIEGYFLTNSTLQSANGVLGTAISFSEADNEFIMSLEAHSITGSYSYSMWVNPDTVTGYQPLLTEVIGSPECHNVHINNGVVYTFAQYENETFESRTAFAEIGTGQWYHIAVVHPEGTHSRIYINGVRPASMYNLVSNPGSIVNPNNLPIVGGEYVGGVQERFNGLIDDVRIYNRALSTEEVERLAFASDVDNGGGIYCDTSALNIHNCRILSNTALGDGGGLYAIDSTLSIDRCLINSNGAANGGAMMLSGCTISDFDQNWMSSNTADQGAGMFLADVPDSVRITNTIFSENTASDGGVAIHAYPIADGAASPGLDMLGCTIADNTASVSGSAGITVVANSTYTLPTTVTSCIFWDNTGASVISCSPAPTVTNSCVQDGYTGTDNFYNNPNFGANYTLATGSPCINHGSQSYWSNLYERFDVDGDRRVDYSDGATNYYFDVGAQEYVEVDCQ